MNTYRPVPIARKLAANVELERQAVRVTGQPGRRVFEMPWGDLLTIGCEQRPDTHTEYANAVIPISREDAEDFFGWSPSE